MIRKIRTGRASECFTFIRGKELSEAAAGKPHIAIKIHMGEDQLIILKKALEIMEER